MKHFSFEGIRTLSEHNWIMDRILVRPSGPLSGDVTIKGAKNSALKLMAACTLTEGTFRLNNVPDITDVRLMSELLGSLGMDVKRIRENTLEIVNPGNLKPKPHTN